MPPRATNRIPAKLGAGCLGLFALPFAVVGVGAGVMAVQKFAAHDWQQFWILAVFAVIFGGVGFGLLYVAIYGARRAKTNEALAERHPDEPWLQRDDWARGEVKSTGKASLLFLWIFTVFWNLISCTVFFGLLGEAKSGQVIWIVAIFPAVGLGLLITAIYQTLRTRRFGESVFKLSTIPGVIGGPLAGVIRTARPLLDAKEIRLRLVCVARDSSGENTTENLLWEDEKVLRSGVLQGGGGIPVLFNIPFDCQPTAQLAASLSTTWRLEASAPMPGMNYGAQFEVPVFKTAQSRADAPLRPDPAAAYVKRLEAAPPRGVSIKPSARGGKEFTFAAARDKGNALGLTAFVAIWTGAIAFMIHMKAPVLFPIAFGLFDLLLLAILSSIWTSASCVVVEQGGLQLTKRWMFLRWRKSFAASEITSVQLKFSMSSGSTSYYDLQAHLQGGKKISLASYVRGKRDSEWLANEMTKALGRT